MRQYTEDEHAYIVGKLNDGRQMIQCARVLPGKWEELIEAAQRVLTECATALEAGEAVETDAEWAARMQHVPTIDETARRIMANDARRDMEDDGK